MSKRAAALIALCLLACARDAQARNWRCGATATFDSGSIGVYVGTDDQGQIKQPRVAMAEYMPGPSRRRLEITAEYAVLIDQYALWPNHLSITTPVNRDEAGGQLVLTLGSYQKSWSIPVRMFTSSDVTTMWVDDPPDKALHDALLAGGQGRLTIVGMHGEVKESQDLTFLDSAALQPLIEKAYPSALGFAADPKDSHYCEPVKK